MLSGSYLQNYITKYINDFYESDLIKQIKSELQNQSNQMMGVEIQGIMSSNVIHEVFDGKRFLRNNYNEIKDIQEEACFGLSKDKYVEFPMHPSKSITIMVETYRCLMNLDFINSEQFPLSLHLNIQGLKSPLIAFDWTGQKHNIGLHKANVTVPTHINEKGYRGELGAHIIQMMLLCTGISDKKIFNST